MPVPPFRGLTAAASLKHNYLGGDIDRRIDPFRGLTAAASLKRRHGLPRVTERAAFPRPHRRGLIEAASYQEALAELAYPFRGLTAAASLKRQLLRVGVPLEEHPFRGLTAAASLKRVPPVSYG